MSADDETSSSSETTESSSMTPTEEKTLEVFSARKVAMEEKEQEEDSPMMKVGKALKPLNDLIEFLLKSPWATPILLLAPTFANPKLRAIIFAKLGLIGGGGDMGGL